MNPLLTTKQETFRAGTDNLEFFRERLLKMNNGALMFCTRGEAIITIDLRKYHIVPNTHITHRQVSLLSAEKVDEFNARGGDAAIGAFGENILVSGIDFKKLPVGSIMRSGEVVMKLTQIGKECHSHCTIFARVGDCIMPREGVFAMVEHGGVLRSGMELEVTLPAADAPLRAAVMTLSDKGAAGERVDTSGPRAAELLAEADYEIVEQVLLPDAHYYREADSYHLYRNARREVGAVLRPFLPE